MTFQNVECQLATSTEGKSGVFCSWQILVRDFSTLSMSLRWSSKSASSWPPLVSQYHHPYIENAQRHSKNVIACVFKIIYLWSRQIMIAGSHLKHKIMSEKAGNYLDQVKIIKWVSFPGLIAGKPHIYFLLDVSMTLLNTEIKELYWPRS